MLTLEQQISNTQLPDYWVLEIQDSFILNITKDNPVDLSPFGEYWVTEIAVDPKSHLLKMYIMKPKPEWYEFWK
ncbi:MAG: hypothetical protein IIW92_12645 [Lachnospiraceae bacterium]|nr:hypothetical protein [Lachnospiraceae bacterium]MBQ5919403.1 hypothetical protein [Lachnospiraceae bacterium]